jgi:phosphoribosylformylglycinamidine cyclo-ligase
VKPVLDRVHAMAHITGGGLPGNLDRVLPSNLDAVVDTSSWKVPNVFSVLQKRGSVDVSEMHRTFNMGVGMVVICAPADVNAVVSAAAATGISAWKLGALRPGAGSVILS